HSRRLWPQRALAKAWVAQAESGEAGAADAARAALVLLARQYLRHPVAGGIFAQASSKYSPRVRVCLS
ncbi:hypothetical protein FNJ47_10355, partial [Bradyrhizobium sp. UFLA 03-164]|nr:hypothetical protein [Bradyrhizobium uaiense]